MRLFITSVVVVVLITSTAYSLGTDNAAATSEREEIFFREVPVVISASRFEQKIGEVPSLVTVITADDIKKFGYQSLADALRGITGFYVSSDREYSRIGVRGYERPGDWGNRILMMINGHCLNENIYGSAISENAFGIDIGDVKRIEIVRGPGSALYGTNAFFAVINIVTESGKDCNELDARVTYGTNNANKGTFCLEKKLAKDVDLLVSGSFLNSEGYKKLYFTEFDAPATNNGWAENCDQERTYSIFANINYGDISIMADTSSRDKHFPTATYNTIFNDSRASDLDERSFAEIKFEPEISPDKTATMRLYFDDYYYVGNNPIDYPPVLLNQDNSAGNWWGGNMELKWDVASNYKLIAGTEYQSHTKVSMLNFNVEPFHTILDFSAPYNLCSVYLLSEIKTNNLGINIGVRGDSYPDLKGVINPRLGLVYEPVKDNYFKVLYGQAFRAPSPFEKYYYDAISSKANLNLKPELIDTYELVFERGSPEDLYLGLSVYRNLISDLIVQVLDPGDNLLQYQNVDKIESIGTEVTLKKAFGYTGSYGYFGCALQRSVDLYTNEELTDSPGISANAGFVYSFLPGTSLATEIIYLSKRRTLAENYTDSYLLTNLALLAEDLLGLTITMKANNLFDTQYDNPASGQCQMDTIPQDGRTYLVSVGHRF